MAKPRIVGAELAPSPCDDCGQPATNVVDTDGYYSLLCNSCVSGAKDVIGEVFSRAMSAAVERESRHPIDM